MQWKGIGMEGQIESKRKREIGGGRGKGYGKELRDRRLKGKGSF